MLSQHLTKLKIITKFTVIVNPGQLIRNSFLGLVSEGLYLKQPNRNTYRIQNAAFKTSVSMFISKIELIHVASRNFWDGISILRLTSCIYWRILIKNLPILDLRRSNYVLQTYINVTGITGWWNSICNSKWVSWTSKTNTSIFKNRNTKRLKIFSKIVNLFCLSKKWWNLDIKIIAVKFYQN